jgi:hypothetical protein
MKMSLKRLKTLIFSLLTTAQLALTGQVFAAGTTPLSLVQQFDSTGAPLAGCLLYFYVAGTVATPQNAYQDFGLTSPLPNPVSCDVSGRVPQHWLADGLIHIRLTDSSGVVQVDTTMQVLGPSSGGGGGGGTVDPTTILATGDEKFRYDNAPLAGWVRENGLTIGNATSGATERANADTQNLFVYLWGKDQNLAVSGGRGANALADYNASKALTLPDMRGRTAVALADMGNTASSVLGSPYCSSPTTLGFACGNQSATLTTPNLPPYTPSGSVTQSGAGTVAGSTSGGVPNTPTTQTVPFGSFPIGPFTFSGNPQGGTSTPFGILQPIMLRTFYLKL